MILRKAFYTIIGIKLFTRNGAKWQYHIRLLKLLSLRAGIKRGGIAVGQGYTIPGKSGMNHVISNLPLLDTPVPTPPLTKAKAVYVRDSATDPWYMQTMYPD